MQVTVNGSPVEYHVAGYGEPVLFVHAFPLNSQMWQPQVEHVSRGYKTVVLDLPGFGESPPAQEAPTMFSYVETVAAVLEAAQVDQPAVLVGLSMGGYILLEFFRRFPERVRALVLADTRAAPDTEEARQNRLDTAEQVLQEGPRVLVESMVPKLLTSRADDVVRLRVREMIFAATREGIAGALRAMAARPDSRPTLETITVPTLVIVGGQDDLTPPAEAEGMAQAIAGAELEVIEGAGHLSNLERQDAFNAALLRFLDDLGSS
ncbi:MAG: alpha/beta hydrolase [Ardenticatenaceae bacterium]|nr:alpha/beta hydrolase [Ardenticatenaceae bacterium]